MNKPDQIAIDGTAASGKSTVGKLLASRLDYTFFDTGIMYRVASYGALEALHDIQNETEVGAVVKAMDIELRNNAEQGVTEVLLNGKNITDKMHLPEVDKVVSMVAAYPEVRKALTAQQRKIGSRGKIVMVGRDIGTVVMPDAPLKIYLAASAQTRARRRYQENLAKGITSETYEEILRGIQERDERDSNREVAPLKPAEDAVIIHTDTINAEQVTQKILELMDEAS